MSFKSLFATAGMAACLVAGPTHATEMKAENANPLLAPWTGPYGGVPPFDQVKVEQLQAGAGGGAWPSSSPRSTGSPRTRQPPTFENTIAAMERAGRTLDRVGTRLRRLQLDAEHAGVPGGRARDGAEAGRLPATRSCRTTTLFARIEAVYDGARDVRARRPSSSASPGCTTPTSCAPAPSSTPPPRSALAEINQRLATLFTQLQPERARRRDGLRARARRARPTSPACPQSVRDGRGRRGRGRAARRASG